MTVDASYETGYLRSCGREDMVRNLLISPYLVKRSLPGAGTPMASSGLTANSVNARPLLNIKRLEGICTAAQGRAKRGCPADGPHRVSEKPRKTVAVETVWPHDRYKALRVDGPGLAPSPCFLSGAGGAMTKTYRIRVD